MHVGPGFGPMFPLHQQQPDPQRLRDRPKIEDPQPLQPAKPIKPVDPKPPVEPVEPVAPPREVEKDREREKQPEVAPLPQQVVMVNRATGEKSLEDEKKVEGPTGAGAAIRTGRGIAGAMQGPPAPPAAAASPELPKIKESELKVGPKLGEGAHSAAFEVGERDAAVKIKPEHRGPGSSAHLQDQVDHMRGLKDVEFEGKKVAPEIKSLITNDKGETVGYVTDKIRGEELGELAARGGLDDKQFAEVERQLRGQLDELHKAGKMHGDPNPKNIMVHVKEDGSVEAKFIDFEKENAAFSQANDKTVLERTLADANAARQPDRVRENFQNKEEQRIEEEKKKIAREQKPVAEQAKKDAHALRKSLPENDPHRPFLEDVRKTLSIDGKEGHLIDANDLSNARQKLNDLKAVERLKAMDLTGEQAKLRDDLVKRIETIDQNCAPPRPADPDAARRAADLEAAKKHGPGHGPKPPPGPPPEDLSRAAYDDKLVTDLKAKGIDVKDIRHENGYTVLKTDQGEMRVQYGTDKPAEAVKSAEEVAKNGRSSIIDTGSMKPEKVEELKTQLEQRKADLGQEQTKLKDQMDELEKKQPATDRERLEKKRDMMKLQKRKEEVDRTLEGLKRTELHNPFPADVQALAKKHNIASDEAQSLKQNLQKLGMDPHHIDPEKVKVGEAAIAEHFKLNPGDKQLPEHIIIKDGEYHAAELKNTADPGMPHTNSPSDVQHTVDKFNSLAEEIEKKGGKVGSFELHARPGAPLGDFKVGPDGILRNADGSQAGKYPIKVVGLDLPATDGSVRNPDKAVVKPGEEPGGRVPPPEPQRPEHLKHLRPDQFERVTGALEKVDPVHRPALSKALGSMDPVKMDELLKNLPPDALKNAGKVASLMDPQDAAKMMKFAGELDPKMAATAFETIAKLDPRLIGEVGKFFSATDNLATKLGTGVTKTVAQKSLHALGKMIPVVGTAFAGYDMVKMGQIALDSSMKPEIRFLGAAGALLNASDMTLGALEAIGIGNFGFPVNLALGGAELTLDLYTHHLIDQDKAGKFKSTPELDTLITGTAAALGPQGAALMVTMFGVEGTQQKAINAARYGGKKFIDAAVQGGIFQADATGKQLELASKGIDGITEMVKDPEKFLTNAKKLGLEAADIGKKGMEGLMALQRAGNEYAAKKVLEGADYLARQGKRGLDTLKWMAENPGEAKQIARQKMVEMVVAGNEAAQEAWNGLNQLGKEGVESAKQAVEQLRKKGDEGLAMLKYAAENPGQAAEEVRKQAVQGMKDLVAAGGKAADDAARGLVDFVNRQNKLADDAADAIGELIAHGQSARFDQVIEAWTKNLGEGGQKVLHSLEKLKEAGADQVGKLAARGGELAREGAASLGRMLGDGTKMTDDFLRRSFDSLQDREAQRRLIASAGTGVRTLATAIGNERLAGLVNDPSTSVDWIRTHLAANLTQDQWRRVAGIAGGSTFNSMMKIQQALGSSTYEQVMGIARSVPPPPALAITALGASPAVAAARGARTLGSWAWGNIRELTR